MKRNRRTRDLAVLLPLGALLLLMPPYIGIFNQPVFVIGIPLLPAYIFSVWAISIVLAVVLSRRVLSTETHDKGDEA